MSFQEINDINIFHVNSKAKNAEVSELKIEQQPAIPEKAISKSGQRRLRTETVSGPLIKAIPDALVEALVKYGNNSDGIPALLYAAKVGDLNAVKLMVDHGADPFAVDSAKNGTLHYALLSKNSQVVEYFLNKGLDPNATNPSWHNGNEGWVWSEAVKLNDIKSFELLIAHGLRLDSAFYSSPFSSPSIVCILAPA